MPRLFHRSHSLTLRAIALKCPLSSFSPWLWVPSAITVSQSRNNGACCWIVARCIRSFFTAGVSGMVHARSLGVKDVISNEVPGAPGEVSSSSKVHPSLVLGDSYGHTIDTVYSY